MVPEIIQIKTYTVMNTLVMLLKSYESIFVRRLWCPTQVLDMAKMLSRIQDRNKCGYIFR
jgi:hypothetical protein